MEEKVIDVKNKTLGRVATQIATLLQGKHKATFSAHKPGDVKVIIKNITQIKVSGRKPEQKIYYRHTGYPGGIRKKTYGELFAQDPKEVLRKAVHGMLPANKLRAVRLKNLIIE